ncbi:unannotated protein [freshwater metagenome]|uniref:Unannotated protein n=1 Tax=freshwater metagenome TaxID=449393 RepID=A0A6J7EL02_9ZZZZ
MQWVTTAQDMVTRVAADREPLQEAFGLGEAAAICGVDWSLSDPHRGGASVAILSFGDVASIRQVVYKPKDIRIEASFQRFVALVFDELGATGGKPAPLITHLLRDGYGYASVIRHEPCAPERLAAFYRNAGRLAAILHLLGSSDCHFENLIASGDRLHLIDAETLFEGQTARPIPEPDGGSVDLLLDSVVRIGMFPRWVQPSAGSTPYDVSALGVPSANSEGRPSRAVIDVNTDAMAWGTRPGVPVQPQSLPVAASLANPVDDHVPSIVEGFREVYRMALDRRVSATLDEAMAGFIGLPRRLVLRNTTTYSILQSRATSPSCLRSGPDRGFELDRLARSALMAEDKPVTWSCFEAEVHDMDNFDVPYFDFTLGSSEIVGGGRTIEGMLTTDGLARARLRLRAMSEADLAWQVRLIEGSFSARAVLDAEPVGASRSLGVTSSTIANDLQGTALTDSTGGVTWLSLSPFGGGDVLQLDLIPHGLYAGRAGVATFLFAQAREAGDEAGAGFAARVLAPAVGEAIGGDRQARYRFARDNGLGMAGLGGLLRALEVLERNPLAHGIDAEALAMGLVEVISPELIARDTELDVMGGAAGAVGAISRIHTRAPSAATGYALESLAGHLVASQIPSGGWAPAAGPLPLTGLAHGASGMGLALIEAGVALNDDRFVRAGARAFAYEATVFDASRGNWPDYRTPVKPGSFMTGWCAGAPGIGLARMRALELAPAHGDADAWRADLLVSAETISRTPLGARDHLCCGNLGRAFVLGALGAWRGEPTWMQAAADMREAVVVRAAERGGFGLQPGNWTSADLLCQGLMQGLSGVGYALLADPGIDDLVTLLV